MKHWEDEDVEEQKFTTWRNPTPHEMRVDIFTGGGRKKRFVVGPGQEVRIPGEFDRGIHDVRDGVIVGGYAPQLERVAGNPPLHPALDPSEIAKKELATQADRIVATRKAAEEVLALTPVPAEKAKK